jgi:hypothetical protein
LAINPSYIPALLNLANLHEDLGRREAAQLTYERILAQDPRCFEALVRYANLTRFVDSTHSLIDRLRDAINDTKTTPAECASVGFALGRALDACGRYDEAFEVYAVANRSSRVSAGTTYDASGWERMVDRLIAAFPSAPQPSAGSDGGSQSSFTPRPIFVCGMFRSGSSLTEQLLANHPQITPGGELDLLPSLAQRILTSFPTTIASAPPQLLADAGRHYLQSLAALFPGSGIVTDKRPDNFILIGVIKTLFPNARIVHTVRDALDNCLSIFFLHLDQRMTYALDLMDIGHYYKHYVRLMTHWKQLFGPDILDVGYDTLVREPREVVQPLLQFLGLDWDERCLEVTSDVRSIKTASVWQVREPLYQRSSGRARHYAKQLAPLRAYLESGGASAK